MLNAHRFSKRRAAKIAISFGTAISLFACSSKPADSASTASQYLFVWAGPHGHADHGSSTSDFLAVLDANAASATYGKVLASMGVGTPGEMAHHTELSLPARHPLFTSDFMTGQIFLIDLSHPLVPRVVARIDSIPGYRRPHSFARLANGNVLVSMQFGNGSVAGDPGGLAELDTGGRLVRTSSAADSAFPGARIRPNGVELLPAIDRVVTTSMPMDDENTADVIQVWRLSDLRLLHTIAMPQQARDSTGNLPYDMRVLADGRTAMLDTYFCGLFRVSAIESEHPQIEFVHALHTARNEGCAVAAVAGHYWIIPAAYGHAIVSVDVTDPLQPVEVSTLQTDSTVLPHWISLDPASDRLVINGADEGESRVMIAHLNRTNGQLSWDERFHDAGSTRPGVGFEHADWPHGKVVHPMAHASLFGPAMPSR
jgi:hypothetical protein